MAGKGPSQAVIAARGRREARAVNVKVRVDSYIKNVLNKIEMTLEQRLTLATEYVKSQVVKNISRPVTKTPLTRMVVSGPVKGFQPTKSYTRVTDRSKPGEFPKADTTQLMKTIFMDVPVSDKQGRIWGYIGTPLDYGLYLELNMDRSFLKRTLEEEAQRIKGILTGPIT